MDMDKYIGRLLDNRYEIREVIGMGGMAVVYKARDHRLNRFVAVKILKDEYSQDEEFRRRFHAESQAVAMLSHPNIVSVHDVSTTKEVDYIVMELIEGITLRQYMEKKGVLNWKETLHFAIQIAKALEHAHGRGIVHRDIKPHNVMILKNGSVKVADFGIARVMSKSNTLTKEALGSVHYISPEQAKGGRVDNRSDIYSLGVVMYEMITGRPPYDGESPVAVAIQHINGGAPLPSTLNPNIPGGLEQIIMKAMSREPADRYDTATAMLYDMDEFRKDPTMLFEYNLPPIDDVTRLRHPVAEQEQPTPRTTAERVAEKRGEQPRVTRRMAPVAAQSQSAQQPRRSASGASRSGQSRRTEERSARERARNEEQEREDAESRSKIAVTAIVACSLVAVVAIGVFLWAILGSGSFFPSQETVTVPPLLGKNYDDLPAYTQIQVVRGGSQYSADYPEGQILSQDPVAGTEVAQGSRVYVIVSQGPEPTDPIQKMQDLVDMQYEYAEEFLNRLNMDLHIMRREEYSDTIQEGCVTRTEPFQDQPIQEGDTITLWVSQGPKPGVMPNLLNQKEEDATQYLNGLNLDLVIVRQEEANSAVEEGRIIRTDPAVNQPLTKGQQVTIVVSSGLKKVKMPDVTGLSYSDAMQTLASWELTNVTREVVDSDRPKDEVVEQSVEKDTEIPINTQIVLKVSSGVTPTPKTMNVSFEIPVETANAFLFAITDDAGRYVFGPTLLSAGTRSCVATLTGSGVQVYTVYVDGQAMGNYTVNFDG